MSTIPPQPPQTYSGLDTSGQFHIGDKIMLGADAGYVRVTCTKSGQAVRVTGESLSNLIAERYFPSPIHA
jgi:hypothetical protein